VLGSATQTSSMSYQLFSAQAKAQPGVTVGAHSMGLGAGDPTFITVNGQRVEMPYGRGLNVVVIDWGSGQVTHRERFDTGHSPEPAEAFASLIEQLAFGQIVAVAVMGEYATRFVTERARRACRMLGSKDFDEQFSRQNSSWAIVGCKGLGAGSVPETINRHEGAAEVESWIPLSPDKAIWSGVTIPIKPIIFVVILVFAIISFVTSIFVLTNSSSGTSPPRSRRRKALLIAIDYTGIPQLDLAGYPSEIVAKVQRSLANRQLFDADDITFMTDQAFKPNLIPSRANIEAALNERLNDAKDYDVLYIHYLGHGDCDTTNPSDPQAFITVLQ